MIGRMMHRVLVENWGPRRPLRRRTKRWRSTRGIRRDRKQSGQKRVCWVTRGGHSPTSGDRVSPEACIRSHGLHISYARPLFCLNQQSQSGRGLTRMVCSAAATQTLRWHRPRAPEIGRRGPSCGGRSRAPCVLTSCLGRRPCRSFRPRARSWRLARVAHLPDRAAGVVGDEERPVLGDGERGGPSPHLGAVRPQPRSRS